MHAQTTTARLVSKSNFLKAAFDSSFILRFQLLAGIGMCIEATIAIYFLVRLFLTDLQVNES